MLKAEELQKMPTVRDESITVNFLIYTRSASFDYQWIYGLNDKLIERALQNHIIKWLDTNLLADRPPVTTFFQIQDYHALVIAQQSEIRFDPQKRPIFQWASFLWTPYDNLSYEHLAPLSKSLKEESEKVYSQIPNDTVRLQPEAHSLTFSMAQLDKGTSNLAEECWQLPDQIDWQEIIQQKLTVEVPVSWGFRKMTSALIDQPIPKSNIIYIGNSLNAGDRHPADQCWLVSARDPASFSQEAQPRILDSNARPLTSIELKKIQERSNLHRHSRKVKSSSSVSTSAKVNTFSHYDYDEKTNSGSALQVDDSRKDAKAVSNEEIESTNIDQLFKEFSKQGKGQKNNKLEFTRLLKMLWESKRSSLIAVESRILLLLTPITQSESAYINVAWNNLLSEILLFNQHASKGMVEEWRRRASNLQTLTIKNLSLARNDSSPQADWSKQFSEACFSLQTVLENL